MKTDTNHHGKRGWSRTETAELLGVTPARVSQIAKDMGIRMRWHWQDGFSYTVRDVARMQERSTKPGPKPTTKGKK